MLEHSPTIPNERPSKLAIAAFDPGRTTGYALCSLEDEALYIAYDEAEFTHDELWNFICYLDTGTTIICENFEFRQGARTGLDLYPVELIGIIKLFADKYEYGLHMQSAATGKGYYSDALLKKHDLYRAGFEHGRDAARHLLHWYMFGPGYQYNMNQKVYLTDEKWVRDRWLQ